MVVLVIERKAMHQRNTLPSIYFNNIVLTFISIYHCIEDPYLFFFFNRLQLPLNRMPQVFAKVNLYYFDGRACPLKVTLIRNLYINIFLKFLSLFIRQL